MAKREVIQIRSTEQRQEQLKRIRLHLQQIGIKPTTADAIDFALAAAEREINSEIRVLLDDIVRKAKQRMLTGVSHFELLEEIQGLVMLYEHNRTTASEEAE
jgi:hypothetical protein